MLPFILGALLFLHVMEGGLFELIATALAFPLSAVVMFKGDWGWKALTAQWRDLKAREPRSSSVLFMLSPRRHRIGMKTYVGGWAWLHVAATPPWFFFPIYGEFFRYGLHIVAFVAFGACLWSRSFHPPREMSGVSGPMGV